MKIAIYPGTFDPVTYGHLDVIERACEIFDRVIVMVAFNTAKTPMFNTDERMKMIENVVRKYRKVSVESFHGLVVSFARKKKATAIVRGLRAVSDFEYEFQMALTNRKLAGEITTVFLMPHEKYTYLNSTLVREIALMGGEISDFVPGSVKKALGEKIKSLMK